MFDDLAILCFFPFPTVVIVDLALFDVYVRTLLLGYYDNKCDEIVGFFNEGKNDESMMLRNENGFLVLLCQLA